MKRETWASRSTFILAAIGSAVGLGNAWRFPGLAAKHGGGAFLLVYLIAMLAVGVPLLMLEIAVGRRIRQGTPGAMRAMNRKAEAVGWIAVSNAVIIEIYYAVVFAWVILMFVVSHKFAGLTGNSEAASKLWLGLIQTTGTTEGFGTFCWPVFGCFIVAWISAFWCIRNGAQSVGKVVKYTVSLPVICLLILAIRGFTMPGAGAGLAKLFIPDWSALSNSALWVDAIGALLRVHGGDAHSVPGGDVPAALAFRGDGAEELPGACRDVRRLRARDERLFIPRFPHGPVSIEEAALLDGASPPRVFFGIVFPLLGNTTATSVILNAVWIWNDYLLPFLVIGNRAGTKTLTLSLYFARLTAGQYANPWELIFPAVLITILPVVVLFLFLQKRIVRGVAAGAVKG